MLYTPKNNASPLKHFRPNIFSESWAVQKLFLETILHTEFLPSELIFYSCEWPHQVSLESTSQCFMCHWTCYFLSVNIVMELEAWLFPRLFNTPFLTVIILNSLNLDHHTISNQTVNLNVMVWLLKIIEIIFSFHTWSSSNTHVSP